MVQDDDSRMEPRALAPILADQQWFWTERWQAMEDEVDKHVAAGRRTVFDGPDVFFDHLDAQLADRKFG